MKIAVNLFSKMLWVFLFVFSSSLVSAKTLDFEKDIKRYNPSEMDFFLNMRYYTSQGNFTKSGNSYDSLPSGYGFETYDFDFGSRMSLSNHWALFGQTTLGASQAKSPTETRTSSVFSGLLLGTDFLMSSGQLNLNPEVSYFIPLDSNDTSGKDAAVSDGASEISARMIASTKFSNFKVGAYGGYLYRDKGLSSLLPYGFFGERLSKSMDWGADLRGYMSLSSDKDTDRETQRDAYQCRANGCAKRYMAINPSLIETNFYGRFHLDEEWDFLIGAGFAITGRNTSTGYSAMAQLVYRWRSDSEMVESSEPEVIRRRPTRPTPKPTFEEETEDGVDQKLFRTAPVAPVVSPEQKQKKMRQQIQDDLNRTEMQIELKSTKKRKKN